MANKFKFGDRIWFSYQHFLNRKSSVMRKKKAIFIRDIDGVENCLVITEESKSPKVTFYSSISKREEK